MKTANFPDVFQEDKNKVFCRITNIKNVVKFCGYRRHKRLYMRTASNRLFPCNDSIAKISKLIESGDLYIWTGNRT